MKRLILCDQSLVHIGGHYFEYTTSIARAARELGLAVLIAANRSVNRSLFQDGSAARPEVLPWFGMTWGEAAKAHRGGLAAAGIEDELLALLEHCAAGQEDVVLLHTLGWEEAESILHQLLDLPADRIEALPDIRLFFRFSLSWLHEPLRSSLLAAFSRLRDNKPLDRKLGFLTDTEPLAHSYSRLFGHGFTVMPIPFRTDLLDGEEAEGGTGRDDAPLTIGYLGDARLEKGYHLLPPLLSRLWRTVIRSGRARFLIQSHFNEPGGEPGMLQARNQLLQFAAPQVELTMAPLPTNDYYCRLRSCDLLLIPYDPDIYAERSSGILVEALVAGKPVVVPRNSWMASQVSPDHAGLYRHPDGLFEAVQDVIDRYPSYAAAARRVRSLWRDRTDPRAYVRALLATIPSRSAPVPAAPAEPALRVALIMDGDAMLLRNGASRVALNQIDHLARCGYRICGLFVSTQRFEGTEAMAQWRAALEERLSGLPVDEIFCLFHLAANLNARQADRLARMSDAGHYSLERDLLFTQGLAFPPALLKAARETRFDLIVLNYVRFLPVVDALGWEGVPLLCEMHDIQSFQKALYGNRPFDPRELAQETALLARCDHVVSLSELEAIRLKEDLGERISHIPMPLFADSARYGRLLDSSDLGRLVASCGIGAATPKQETAVIEKAKALSGVDLLFVSSGHEPNCRGLIWFLETVYAPHLARAGVTLFVAGSIASARAWPDHPNIVFTGMLDDVSPLYAAAKLVILPIHEGAGGAIKLIEAVAAGKPIVATSFALRGTLQDEMDGDFVCDTSQDFASAILALLGSPERRKRCRDLWHQAYERSNSLACYDERMAAVVGRLLGRPPASPPPRVTDALPAIPVEWGPGIQALSRLLSDWAEDRPLDFETIGALGTAYGKGWPSHVRSLLASLKEADRLSAVQRFAGTNGALIGRFADLIDIARPLGGLTALSGPRSDMVRDDLGRRHYVFYAGTVLTVGQRLWRTTPHEIVVTCLSATRLSRLTPGILSVQMDGRDLPGTCLQTDEAAGIIRVVLPAETELPGAQLCNLSLTFHDTMVVTGVELVTEVPLSAGREGTAAVIGDNWHGPERERGRGVWRWTGPERSSWLRLPVFTDPRMRVALCLTDSVPDRDAVPDLLLDGYPMRLVGAKVRESERELVYAFGSGAKAQPVNRKLQFGSADLILTVPATAPHPEDGSRRCGVAVGGMRVITDLLPALDPA